MLKKLVIVPFLLLLFSFTGVNSFGQCQITTEWTFNPPIPPGGAYDAGTTITMCGEVIGYSAGGANWISGITLVLPDAWDDNTITSLTGPSACGSGEWLYFETLDCNGFTITDPGFYYDSNVAGPQDGNPCNNWGDGSTPCGTWEICFDVTLDADCGGVFNPFDGLDVSPTIQVYSDGEIGSWGIGTGCASTEFIDPPDVSIILDCCDAEAGVPPADPVDICGNVAFPLVSLLGPPVDAGGTWSGPAGWTPDGTFTPSSDPALSDPPGDYVYSVVGTDGCIKTSTITMQFIDLGEGNGAFFCESDPLVTESLNDLWNDPVISIPAGGTWTFSSGATVAGGLVTNSSPSGVYTYGFVDGSGCFSQVSMEVSISPSGGVTIPPNFIEVCLLDGTFLPFDSLLGTPADPFGGTWVYYDDADNFQNFGGAPAQDYTLDPFNSGLGGTQMVDGYIVYFSNNAACGLFSSDTIYIDVGDQFDPGLFTNSTLCQGDGLTDLVGLLDGTPDSGGNWEDASGNPVPNPFDPASVPVDATYQFVYIGGFAGTSCFSSQLLQLTVVSDVIDAGADAVITVCESDAPVEMTTILNGTPQPGGTWTGPAGFAGGDFFVPGTSPAGVYTYTISTPCGTESSTLTVTVTTTSNAGIDGTLSICPADVNIPLFSGLTGTPQTGGVWSLAGTPVSPTVSGSSVTNGAVYQYSVGSGSCAATSEVTISLQPAPFPGALTTAAQQYCASDPSFSLNTLFTTPPSIVGNFCTNPSGTVVPVGTLNPATAASGIYTYTVTNGCGTDNVTIFISIEQAPNAGASGSLPVCENAIAPVDLFSALGTGVTAGGAWAGPGGPATSIFNIGDPAGAYTYTVSSSPFGLCTESATITVSYTAVADAGTDRSVIACDNDITFFLFDSLGGTPDPGGTWSPFTAFTPGVSPSGTPSTYTILNPGCPPSTASVTVTVQPAPSAGTNTSIALCQSLGSIDLTSYLNGSPQTGGVWTDSGTGATVPNSFDISASCGNTIQLEYTVTAGACSNSSTMQITVECPPNAGADVTTTECADNTNFNLFSILDVGADATGTFTNNTSGLTVPGGIVQLNGAAAGTYSYTVAGAQCANDVATCTLNLESPITVVIDAQCTPAQTEYVVTLTVSGGDGNYSVTGLPGGPFVGNTYVSNPIPAGNTYSFSVDDSGPCASFVQGATAGPNCTCPANAQFVGPSVSICEGGTADIELNFPSGTGPFTIDYTDGTNTFTNVGPFTSGSFLQVTPTTTTFYTLTGVSDQNCSTSVNSSITVVVEPTPDAGPDVVSTFCGSGGVIVLSSLVDPAIAPGVFTNSSGTTVSTIPQTSASSGTYTYTVSGTQCPDDQATYALTILDPISVSVVSAVCNPAQTDYTVTLEISGGDGNYTVSGIAGTLNTGVNPAIFTSNLIPTGTPYSYVVSDGGPCPDVLAGPINSPNCACPASAQFADPSVTICAGSTANIELNFPSGASPFTIDYTDGTNTFTNQGPFTSGSFLQVTPATTTTYTLTGVSDQNCSTSVNDVIQVVVEPIPNAGPDVTEDLCGAGGTLSLSSLIDPSDDQSGIFTNPGGVAVTNVPLTSASSGTYTYTISGNQCPDDQATYTLTISNPISVNVASAVCNPAQTGYTVTLEISGGDGNYTVSGLAGTLNTGVSPAIFTSNLIPTGTPYSYVVSDGGPCPDVVAGPINSPNCACPANVQFADPSVTICEGSTANIELNFPSGTGPFTIDYNDGTNTFTNEGPYTSGDFLSVNPAVTTTYNLTGVADQNCNTSASGSITVFVETPPNAGPDVTETFCASGAPFNLINLVDGSVASTTGSFFTSAGNPVPGNTITLNSASSDVYTYEVTGTECPADEASYVITINDQVAISNISVDCNSAQTGYTVSFDIVGGDGNYTVVAAGAYDGTIIPGGTVSYESALIPNDTDYSFTISDGSPCSDQVVSGIDPDCDCPASAALSGTASICSGGCATLTFNFQGDGPWDVVYENSLDPSNPEALTDIPNGHIITVCPDETVTYTILSVNDINCSGPVNGQPVTITVDSPLTVSSVTETCDNIGENYTVGFTVSDGVPGTYQVTPTGESFVGGAYESFDINSGDSYSFTVSDAGACPDVLVEGVEECACITEAGSIAPGLIETCENENLTIPINGDEVLDGNDGYQFILHDGSETEIGTIISRYDTPTFPVPTEVEFGQIYYITGVAGNTEFFGDVILTGECTDQTNGIPVIFHGLPSAQLTGLGAVCPGEEAELTVLFTGEGPWIFEYAIDGVSQTSISTADVEYAFTTTTTGSYTLVTVTDQNCEGPVSGQVQVTNFNTPTAVLSGDGDVCENSGDGPVVNLTGQAPFTLIYSIDGVPSPDPITSFSNELTIPAEVGGNYSLTSLTDANCVGTVSGNLDVTILTLPTAEITGGGSVCEGDELPFQVSLTGDGPWTVNYSVDGIPQPSITSPSNVFTFLSDIGGEYNITQVTDQNCEGEALESDASLIVNPLPTAEITSNEDAICIGQELELIYDLQGTPPFTLTYLLDSDTITLSGLTTDFLQTLQPTSPVFTEVLYIEDSSNPVCANTPNNSKFIPVGELPNMPVLEDYTICSEIDTLAIGEDGVPELEYSWTPADRLSNPNSPNPSFILGEDDLSPFVKEYTYVLTASNGDCVSDDTLTITVDPGPRARFSYNPNPVNSEDTKVRFLNQSSTDEDAIYFWQFDSLDTSQEYNPVFEFPGGSIANYTVILTVIDPMTGCIDEWSDIVEVKPEMIVYVPTAFTPDGDGLNDLWRPIMSNIDENDYVLLVYDRFGTVVFETSDPEKAWNGSSNGDDYFVKTGVYVWQIETKNPISLEDIDFKGTVTVIR